MRYRNYLQSYYRQNAVAKDDKLLIAPCTEFINVMLNEKDNLTQLEIDCIMTVDSSYVVVEGSTGMGKSTLCWELCRKWDSFKLLQDFKIVLLLKLRERRLQKATELKEVFHHDDPELNKSLVDEMYRCEGEGVLLVLDGFDELPESVVKEENQSSLIIKLVKGSCLPRAKRIVTTRPAALVFDKKCFPSKYRHIEICGFTDHNKIRYAELAFKLEPNTLVNFKKFIISNPVVNSLITVPVNCAILAQVYKDIRQSRELMPKTMTQLYTDLTLVLIRRHMIEKGEWKQDTRTQKHLKDLPDCVMAVLKRVSKLAYRGLFKKDTQLSFSDDDVGDDFQHLGLLNESKEMYVCQGARTLYSFFHQSMQEFLAAWFMSCNRELIQPVMQNTILGDILTARSYRLFKHSIFNLLVLFLSGMCQCRSSFHEVNLWKKLSEQIDRNEDLMSYFCRCVYEAQDSCNFESLLKECKNIDFSRCYTIALATPLDMYAFGYCLAHLCLGFNVKQTDVSLGMLLSALSDSSASDVSGFISNLAVNPHINSLAEFSELLKCMGRHVRGVSVINITDSFIDSLVKFIPAMHSIVCLNLSFDEYCEHDYLLYKAISNLTNISRLSVRYCGCTRKGVQELSKVICSLSIEEISLEQFSLSRFDWFESQSLADAALQSLTLKKLTTNFAFSFFKSKNVQDIIVNLPKWYVETMDLQRILTSMWYCNRCTDSHLKAVTLGITHGCSSSATCNFTAILNGLINHCQSSGHLKIFISHFDSCYLCPFLTWNEDMSLQSYGFLPRHRTLGQAFRKETYLSSCRLKRSQSLGDLSPSWKQSLGGYSSAIFFSCPDFLELQALNKIHPELSIPMNCDALHYDNDFWRKNRFTVQRTNEARGNYRKSLLGPDVDCADKNPRALHFFQDSYEYIDMSLHNQIVR